MLFLNLYVIFGTKQSSLKLVNNFNLVTSNPTIQQPYTRIQNSLLTAKSTTVILIIVLTVVLFTGETLLNLVLDSSSSYASILAHS